MAQPPDDLLPLAPPGRRTFLTWAAAVAVPVLPVRWSGGGLTTVALIGPPPAATLAVQPLGATADTDVAFVERALAAFFDFRIERLPGRPLPVESYYAPRHRHRADKILEALARQTPGRILGVTAGDISTTKGAYADWGIMGLGAIGGRTGVISSFRCRRRASTPAVATVRLGKTAVHEVGHTLGLEHCPQRGCLMEDAAGSVLTSDRDTDLCERCRARLATLGFVVKRPAFRWSVG